MALSASTASPSAASDALSLGEADLLFVYILRKAAELPNAEQFGKVIGSGVLLGAAECVERLAAAPGGAPRLAASGVIAALVSLLERLTHPAILTRVAGSIRYLASHSETRGLLVPQAASLHAGDADDGNDAGTSVADDTHISLGAGAGGARALRVGGVNALPPLLLLLRECKHAAVLEQVGWALASLAMHPNSRAPLLRAQGALAALSLCRGEFATREPAVLEASAAALAAMCAHRRARSLLVGRGGPGGAALEKAKS